eukprot:TRINITY_DN374_c0_g1_i2.p1 TRINITY_DN374_c0_g1~~TRINITY_DN374_c0_g1_i2.p1  ORF type:complete len:132 (-),score=12.22 TRINITY_DN374_c0_g1_i2:73-468(-)
MSKEFSWNFAYDFARSVGRSDYQHFSKVVFVPDSVNIVGGFLLNMAYLGWANGRIFACDQTPRGDDESTFALGVSIYYSFEGHIWKAKHKKSNVPRCQLASGYIVGWCEQHFNMPLVAVEVSCVAQGKILR